jgi:hypothetical protein
VIAVWHPSGVHDNAEFHDLDLSDVHAGAEPWRRRRFVRCWFEEADLRGLVIE